jgi:calmodulin
MKRADPGEEFRKAFGIFDRDGNGSISSGELKQVMINLEQGLTSSEVEEIYRRTGKEEIDQE